MMIPHLSAHFTPCIMVNPVNLWKFPLNNQIMEQCVARLDVAMFNAILRESADEIPEDPISDPISDAVVLPILSGKASFGAGAQLKNVVSENFSINVIHYIDMI